MWLNVLELLVCDIPDILPEAVADGAAILHDLFNLGHEAASHFDIKRPFRLS